MQSTESSVCSIVKAFTSGLDIFKKIRARKQHDATHSSPKGGAQHNKTSPKQRKQSSDSGDELRLSKSLRRGSADVQKAYEEHIRHGGPRFASGDVAAQASLAHTLLKLNTGLVNIISSFLSDKQRPVSIDYNSLASLSDASRIEAIDAMDMLHKRLTMAEMSPQIHPRHPHSRPRKTKKPGQPKEQDKQKNLQETRKTERAPGLPPGVAKLTVNTSQTQLAWARPANKRKGSSTSTVSRGGRSMSGSSSQQSSTPSTPLPLYSATVEPAPEQHSKYEAVIALPPSHPTRHAPLQPTNTAGGRRQDKVTPSFYSFASDSTKLGEIPMHKWNVPFDFAEMERRNAEALATGWRPPPPPPTLEQQQKGKSLFTRMFRRGAAIEVQS